MTTKWKWSFVSFFTLLALLFFGITPLFDDQLHIVVCDVGQGDGILIYHKSTQILVDAGPDNKILKCLDDHIPFWDREIELAVLTNPDLDHYGGFTEVLNRFNIGLFASTGIIKADSSFKLLQNKIAEKNIENKVFSTGNVLKLGNIILESKWPTKEYLSEYPAFTENDIGKQKVLGSTTESVNKWSEVFVLSYKSFKALLTGDIQNPTTDDVANIDIGPVDVLKVPHHGSKNGLTENLLKSVDPKLSVISAGAKNRYGHPHQEILDLLSKSNTKVLCTCNENEIEIITDGKSWRVR